MKKKFSLKIVAVLGLMIALEIVLSRFQIHTSDLKLGFGFVPIVVAAVLYGPIAGGMVGAIGDIVSAILFPVGQYFPAFTVTAFLTGVIFGLFLYKKESILNVVLSVLLTQAVISQFVNTYFISILYGNPYWPLFITRLAQTAIMSAVQIALIILLTKKLIPILKKRIDISN